MIILQDSREQRPLEFDDPFVEEVKVMGLPVGDYMVKFTDGREKDVPDLSFERKSLADLFGTMGKGHDRFKREIEKAAKLGIHLVILIEATRFKVLGGYARSTLAGSSVLMKLYTLKWRYGLGLEFCKDRAEAALHITEEFKAIGRNYH